MPVMDMPPMVVEQRIDSGENRGLSPIIIIALRIRELLKGAEYAGMSIRAKALQAWQTLNELQEAAVSGLIARIEARGFREAFRLPDFKQLEAEYVAEGYSGNALYRKVFDKICDEQACFVAGTPVWTDRGLVPIEQIKVGDMVLSKPENDDNAPTAYRRVTDVFSRVNADVMLLECRRPNLNAGRYEYSAVIATYEHPFWAQPNDGEDWAWESAGALQYKVRLRDGDECEVAAVEQIRQWLDENEQPVQGLAMASESFNSGRKIDFRGIAPIIEKPLTVADLITFGEAGYPETNYAATVFNLTVEEYHTYFVGDWGFWAHNACFKNKQ